MNRPINRRPRRMPVSSASTRRVVSYRNYHKMSRRRRRSRRAIPIIIGCFVLFIGLGIGVAALFGAFAKNEISIPPSSPAAAQPAVAGGNSPQPSVVNRDLLALALKAPLINFDNPSLQDKPENLMDIKLFVGSLAKINDMVVEIDGETGTALKALLEAAYEDGITTLIINSTYREKALQKEYYDNRVAEDPTYGQDPYTTPVKVLPDYASEHCAALAVDITCDEVIGGSTEFANTTEGKWLAEHAHEYGFILRYPEDKQHITGVVYEPWHFRYVGEELARAIYESGLCMEEFYENLGL